MKHSFTEKILSLIAEDFGDDSIQIFENSELLKYLNQKMKSAHKGSKSRGSFGNIYAIYILVEDYLNNNFQNKGDYSKYEGAKFSDLFTRQRELPFGKKLQNHALNQRMNQEFKKFFPTCEFIPIIRVVDTKRYWINENLLKVNANTKVFNISATILKIVEAYIDTKRSSFERFIETCEELKTVEDKNLEEVKNFIFGLLQPNIDARIFEIVSYAILKASYKEQSVYFGHSYETVAEENLELYKTGRTNANDGGIDFVMKPLGRFFQVTETTDVKKYFLDIDKLEKFPITFVVKSEESVDDLRERIRQGAIQQYSIEAVVTKYMDCIEEIINLPELLKALDEVEATGKLPDVLSVIIKQSKVEFNYDD